MISNARLGGDNCHRGVVLGALLGAQGGMHAAPQAWISDLHGHDCLQSLLEKLSALALKGA